MAEGIESGADADTDDDYESDRTFNDMTEVALKVVSNARNGAIYTVAVTNRSNDKIILFMICDYTTKKMRLVDVYGREVFHMSPFEFTDCTKVMFSTLILGFLDHAPRMTQHMTLAIGEEYEKNFVAFLPSQTRINYGKYFPYSWIYAEGSTEPVAQIAPGNPEALVLMGFAASANLKNVQKKIILAYACQLTFTEYQIHKLTAPEVSIAVCGIGCNSCKMKKEPTFQTHVPNCVDSLPQSFMIRGAGMRDKDKAEFYDLIDLNKGVTTFTLELAFRDGERQLLVIDGRGRRFYTISNFASNLLKVISENSNVVGEYDSESHTFHAPSGTKLDIKIHEKDPPGNYERRWGKGRQFYVDPNIALITSHHCGVGVTFNNYAKIPNIQKALVLAYAMKLNLEYYKFNKVIPLPKITYLHQGGIPICERCLISNR